MVAVDLVYEFLRGKIIKGEFVPGQRLREETLADDLGVGRTPVREALRRLKGNGLVEIIANRGAQVIDITDRDLEDSYELRALLEGFAARRAAEHGCPHLDDLRKLCEQMEDLLSDLTEPAYDRMTELNLRFHHAIYTAGEVKVLPSLLSGVVQVPLVRHTFHRYTRSELDRSFSQHRQLIEAIEAKDGFLAESTMRSHILSGRISLRRAARASPNFKE
jgi:DNA-binding GntR family transcriptional regulator